MRHLGTLPSEVLARRFEDYAIANGIEVRAEPENGEWSIWLIEEDHLEAGRSEFAAFRDNPEEPKYRAHNGAAEKKRQADRAAYQQFRKNQIDPRRNWGRGGSALKAGPVTLALIALSVIVSLSTNFGNDREGTSFYWLTFFSREKLSLESKLPQWEGIRSGEVWRLFSPMVIHFSPMHLLFNMLWLHRFGSQIEPRLKSLKFLLLVLCLSSFAVVTEYFWLYAQHRFATVGGMSGVGYGLFGFIWMKVRFAPEERYQLSRGDINLFLIWLVVCATGMIGPVANAAHAGGLALGCALGWGSVQLKRRR